MGVTFGVSHCERNRLRDCDTRVQRTIHGPKRDKVTGDLYGCDVWCFTLREEQTEGL